MIMISELPPQQFPYLLNWALLLDADPNVALVKSYLTRSRVLVAFETEAMAKGKSQLPETAKEVIGSLVFEKQAANWEILNVAVAPQRQGQGIGGKLMDACLANIDAEADNLPIIVKTGDLTSPALSLYQKKGFDQIALVKDYFVQHYPEPIFEDGQQLRNQVILERKPR